MLSVKTSDPERIERLFDAPSTQGRELRIEFHEAGDQDAAYRAIDGIVGGVEGAEEKEGSIVIPEWQDARGYIEGWLEQACQAGVLVDIMFD